MKTIRYVRHSNVDRNGMDSYRRLNLAVLGNDGKADLEDDSDHCLARQW
jgi:hypothetical protein